MSVYVYKGIIFPKHRRGQMLSMVVGDHDDEYNEAWQTWFEGYLESLDMERLWAEFVSDYLDEHGDEVMEKHKDEIKEVEV